MRTVIATTPTCTICKILLPRLEHQGLAVTAVDLAADETWMARVTELGYSSAPVFLLVDDHDTVIEHSGAYDRGTLQSWAQQTATGSTEAA